MKKSILLSTSLLAMSMCSVTANAWNALGHQVIAHIAYQELKPSAKKKVDALVTSFNYDYPNVDSFDELAVWPDAVRSQKIETYTRWHYIDMPIIEDNVNPPAHMHSDNAVWALDKIKPVVENNKANQFERARFLAFLAHIVGDLHQPLHTTELFSAKHPEGDRGGNDYTVYYHNKPIKLHALWDRGVGAFEGQANFSSVDVIARSLIQQYPRVYFSSRINLLDSEAWLQEGMNNAKKAVYNTPEGQTVSQAYITNGRKLSEEQATLAGYRLGNILNQLLG